MRTEGSPEPLLGSVGPPECSMQPADAVSMRAHETDQRAVDRAAVGHRHQVLEELLAQRMVGDGNGRLHELADENRPQVRPLGAPVLERQHYVKFTPSTVDIPGTGQEARRHRMRVGRNAHPPLHGQTGGVVQGGGVTPQTDHLEQLGHAHVAGIALADGLAQSLGLGREPVSAVDVAVEQGECGAPRLEQIVVARLVQPFSHVAVFGHGRLERRRAEFQLCGGGE